MGQAQVVDWIGLRPTVGRAGSLRGQARAPAPSLTPTRLRSAERGFTLLEMMVALAIFSLAALALLKLQGVTLRTAADLDRRTLAQATARNLMVETLTDPAPPPLGDGGGVVSNGGRALAWTRNVQRDADPRFLLVTVTVGAEPGASPAVLSFVRRGS